MGSSGSVLEKKRLNMNLHYFALFLLLVLTVNGAPKPDPKASPKAAPKPNPKPKAKPDPKADPKAKAQMAIIFNNKKHGGDGAMGIAVGEDYADAGNGFEGHSGAEWSQDFGNDYWSGSFGKKGNDYWSGSFGKKKKMIMMCRVPLFGNCSQV